MKTKLGFGLVALGIVVLLPLTSWAQSGPFFGTFLPNGQPEDTFSPSENLLLKGGNWGANKRVGAVFDQNPRSALGTSVTDDQGDFTMLTSIPGGATNGPAVITVAVSFATGTVTRSRPVHITGSGVGDDRADEESEDEREEEEEREDENEDEDAGPGGRGQQQQQQQGDGDGQQQQSGGGQQQQQQVLNVAASQPARSSKLPATGTQAGLMGGTGSSLILLGLGLLVWANRRRRNPLRPPPPWSLLPPGVGSVWVSSRPRPSLPASVSRSLPALPPGPPDDGLVEGDILALYG